MCLTAESVDLMVRRDWGHVVTDRRAQTPLVESCAALHIKACALLKRQSVLWTAKLSLSVAMIPRAPRRSMVSASANPSARTRHVPRKAAFVVTEVSLLSAVTI